MNSWGVKQNLRETRGFGVMWITGAPAWLYTTLFKSGFLNTARSLLYL